VGKLGFDFYLRPRFINANCMVLSSGLKVVKKMQNKRKTNFNTLSQKLSCLLLVNTKLVTISS
jgi:hypothetical protein